MSPHGVSCALSEDESSNSLMVDSSAESGNESTILSSVCSQGSAPEQGICHSSTESESLHVPVSGAAKLQPPSNSLSNSAYLSEVLSQLEQCKRNMSSPVKQVLMTSQLNPCSSDVSSAQSHLTVRSKEKTSVMKDMSQQMTDYIDSNKMDELSIKGAENEYILSSASLFEPSIKAEKPEDNCSGSSKVVVQAMPLIDFGNISALQQCISDSSISRKSWSDFKSGFSETGSRKRLLENTELSATPKSKILQLPLSGINETQDAEDDDFRPSSYFMKRIRRNHSLNFHIRQGRGMKLANIEYIASALSEVLPSTLRLVHYVMFGTYGNVRSDSSIEQTKANILHFSGFVFNELSEEYKKKCKSLMRLPYPLLSAMYNLLVRQESIERTVMVRQLLQFCLKPAKRKVPSLRRSLEVHNNRVSKELKNHILKGPSPVVLLERLSEQYIKRMVNTKWLNDEIGTSGAYGQGHCKKYIKPYIANGPGHKLKSFPNVIDGVYKARRRIINLLHSLLYGRPGSDEVNRLNILEFSGFVQHDKYFLQRKVAILNKYKKEELEQICDIFSLHVKGGNKIKKIKKLLFYLQAPSLVVNSKRRATGLPLQAESQSTQKLKMPANELLIESTEPRVTKLRDFEKVCLNIECAPPGDLAELNDILFIKPCDVSEIHEKILNFTPFPFDENSLEFHYRKTLMHYMGFEVIKKIARILDIPFWEHHPCQQELAMTTLKFLMKMKQPAKVRKRVKYVPQQTKREVKRSARNQKCRPHILMVQRDRNFCSEREETHEYLESSSSGKINSMHTSDGFHENGDTEDGSNSTVVIQRISESSYSWTDLKNNGPITISNLNSDESLSLHEFAHHPTENQLELTIKEVICSNSWSITTGNLLNKVLHHYPKYNLMYRCEFIKAKALEILHEMQECIVDSTLDKT